jgi:hypothetical protein
MKERGLSMNYVKKIVVVLAGCMLLLLFAAWAPGEKANKESSQTAGAPAISANDQQINNNMQAMFTQGRKIFRYDTFGDEAFWGGALHLHQAIAGEHNGGVGPGVSPSAGQPGGADKSRQGEHGRSGHHAGTSKT